MKTKNVGHIEKEFSHYSHND